MFPRSSESSESGLAVADDMATDVVDVARVTQDSLDDVEVIHSTNICISIECLYILYEKNVCDGFTWFYHLFFEFLYRMYHEFIRPMGTISTNLV